MINYDHLRRLLCTNCLLDMTWNLHQQLNFLYLECKLSTRNISNLCNNYVSLTTVSRLLTKFKIPLRNRGGINNPYGRSGKED